jgi:hypothetical protein
MMVDAKAGISGRHQVNDDVFSAMIVRSDQYFLADMLRGLRSLFPLNVGIVSSTIQGSFSVSTLTHQNEIPLISTVLPLQTRVISVTGVPSKFSLS